MHILTERNGYGYATNRSGSWVLDKTNPTNLALPYRRYGADLAIDASDKVHIVYSNVDAYMAPNIPKYMTNSSGSWTNTVIDSANYQDAARVSLALDATGAAHVFCTGPLKVAYSSNTSGAWVTEIVDTVTTDYNSIAYYNGSCYVAYYDYNLKDLKYATNKSGTWKTKTFDYQGDVGQCCSIAVFNGIVHITYYDYTYGNFKHLTWNNP